MVRDHALPDEHAADALWWRLAGHLTPAILAATEQIHRAGPDPAWTPALTAVLGAARAQRVRADPAWPALIAVISDASHAGWPPDQLIDTAASLATNHHGQGLPDHELAEALVWRIAMLNDPSEDPAPVVDPRPDLADLEPAGSANPQQAANLLGRARRSDQTDSQPATDAARAPSLITHPPAAPRRRR